MWGYVLRVVNALFVDFHYWELESAKCIVCVVHLNLEVIISGRSPVSSVGVVVLAIVESRRC